LLDLLAREALGATNAVNQRSRQRKAPATDCRGAPRGYQASAHRRTSVVDNIPPPNIFLSSVRRVVRDSVSCSDTSGVTCDAAPHDVSCRLLRTQPWLAPVVSRARLGRHALGMVVATDLLADVGDAEVRRDAATPWFEQQGNSP
jgi:hypothetical protein